MKEKVLDYYKQHKSVFLTAGLELLYLLLILRSNGVFPGFNIYKWVTMIVGIIVLGIWSFNYYQKKWDNKMNVIQSITMLCLLMLDGVMNRSLIGVVVLFFLLISMVHNAKKDDLHDFRKGMAGLLMADVLLELASVSVLARRPWVDWRLNTVFCNYWWFLSVFVFLLLYRISLSVKKIHLFTRVVIRIGSIAMIFVMILGVVDYLLWDENFKPTMRENEYAILSAYNHNSALTINGALLTYQRYEEWDNQHFFIMQQKNGEYWIGNQDDSYHMDLYQANYKEDNKVNFWEKGEESRSQRWKIVELPGGYVQLKTADNEMYAARKHKIMEWFCLLTADGDSKDTVFVMTNEVMRDGIVGALYDDRTLLEYIVALAMCCFLWLVDRNILHQEK